MYFVVECTTRSAPSASGFASAGEAKVLSTTTRTPRSCASSDEGGDVGHRRGRVADRLEPQQLRVRGRSRPRPRRDRSVSTARCRMPERSRTDPRQADRAAVHRVRNARPRRPLRRMREHDGVDRRHARGGDEARLAALELGEGQLERLVGRVRVARVRVPGSGELEQLGELGRVGHLEGARGVDRHVHRRLRRVGHAAGRLDGARREARHGSVSLAADWRRSRRHPLGCPLHAPPPIPRRALFGVGGWLAVVDRRRGTAGVQRLPAADAHPIARHRQPDAVADPSPSPTPSPTPTPTPVADARGALPVQRQRARPTRRSPRGSR